MLSALIDERVQVTNARDSGVKLDEAEIDRAVSNVALQNQLTIAQLRQKLRQEGIEYAKFRATVRDQMLVERVREREVMERIRISEAEIDALLDERRAAAGIAPQLNIAQILVTGAGGRQRGRGRRAPGPSRGSAGAGSGGRAVRSGREGGLRRRQSRRRRRDRPAPGRPAARRLRQRGARTAQRRRGAGAAAQRRRFSRAEAGRAPRGRQFHGPADTGPPHPAADVGAADAGCRDAAPRRHQADDRRRHEVVRAGWPARTPRTRARRRAATSAGSRPAPSCPSSRK